MRDISKAGRGVRRGGLLQGCLIALVVIVVLLGVAGYFAYTNFRSFAAQAMQTQISAAIDKSQLPEDQKAGIKAEVQTLAQDFKDKKVTLEQLGQILEELTEGPILPIGGVALVEEKYIKTSAMTDEEKAASVRTLRRFARGLAEKKIQREVLNDVVKPIVNIKADGSWQFKETVTAQELQQFLDAVKTKADEAQIPDEDYVVDVAGEVRRAIAKVRSTVETTAPAAPK